MSNYFEAKLTVTITGEAANRAAFIANLDRLLDGWQDNETELYWQDANAEITLKAAAE